MPAATPVPIRQALWHRWEQGATTTELSQAFGLPPRTVRGLIQRGRQRGEEGLAPDYPTRPDPPPPPGHPAFGPAVALRQAHPGWGAGRVRIALQDQEIAPLPSERTLQRWFRRVGLGPAPPGRRPESQHPRATVPHQVWQIDGAEQMPLGDGSRACWLRIADECTGAVLQTAVFPPRALGGRARRGHPRAVAAGLRPLGTAPRPPRR